MKYFRAIFSIIIITIHQVKSMCSINKCQDKDSDKVLCAYSVANNNYTIFPSVCKFEAYQACYKVDFKLFELSFCLKYTKWFSAEGKTARREFYEEESCPVFCPKHYRPVCGRHSLFKYKYRSFLNGCYMDMINCRGDQESSGYVEVPLSFCQNHLQKNIFQERIITGGAHEYNLYDYKDDY